MAKQRDPGFETICMHLADDREAHFGAAAPPIYQNSTFTFPDSATFHVRQQPGATRFDYTRTSNPTTRILEKKIARLEQGEDCRAFGSGMGAITAAILSCVSAGDHIVTIDTVYGPTRKLLTELLPRFGVETTFVRGTAIDQFEAAIRPNTRLLFVESPSSIFLELQDLAAVAKLAQSRNIVTICDNSNATPVFQNPIAMGIDLVVHTATKYIGGHSDVVAGLIVGTADRMDSIGRVESQLLGATCDPFAAWLMLRGLRTLPIRMERHRRSGLEIARFLMTDARVGRTFYPGLDLHPQHGLAKRQMRGQSGLFSFELRENTQAATFAVVDALAYFSIGVSWGGYESLAVPLYTVDPATGKETWVIRLSVGLETVEDLKADLYQALNRIS